MRFHFIVRTVLVAVLNIVRNLGELEVGVGHDVYIIVSRDAFCGWVGWMMRSLIELSFRLAHAAAAALHWAKYSLVNGWLFSPFHDGELLIVDPIHFDVHVRGVSV